MRTPLRIAAASLVLLTGVACGDDGNDGDAIKPNTSNSPTSGSTDTVKVKGTEALKFDPDTLTAKVGDQVTVELSIEGSVPHNFKLEQFGVKDSETLVSKSGEPKTFTFTADKAGTFDYVCTIHPGMTGKLTVS